MVYIWIDNKQVEFRVFNTAAYRRGECEVCHATASNNIVVETDKANVVKRRVRRIRLCDRHHSNRLKQQVAGLTPVQANARGYLHPTQAESAKVGQYV
jgi:hypothetical protein